jgi:hypothetical protein
VDMSCLVVARDDCVLIPKGLRPKALGPKKSIIQPHRGFVRRLLVKAKPRLIDVQTLTRLVNELRPDPSVGAKRQAPTLGFGGAIPSGLKSNTQSSHIHVSR